MPSGGSSGPAGGEPLPIDPERRAETRIAAIMAPLTVVHFLALAFVTMRLYTRVVLIKAPGRDDWVMLASLICAFGGYVVLILMATLGGMGHHFDTTTPEEQMYFNQLGFWMSIVATIFSLALLKISIALNLLRLGISRWFVWALWGALVFVVLFNVMAFFTWVFRCMPLKFLWDKSGDGYCYSVELFVTFGIINTSFNIATDVFFATIPIPIIWSLQMRRKVRLYLIAILSLGYSAVALGIVKAVFQIGYAAITDRTYYNWVQFWGFLQLNTGIIAACAPSIKPLVNKALGLGSSTSYGSSNIYGGSRSQGTPGLATIGGSGAASGLRSKHRERFELDELEEEDRLSGNDQHAIRGLQGHTETTATFYKSNTSEGERSGSEEMILGTQQGPSRGRQGIMRTREVTVT